MVLSLAHGYPIPCFHMDDGCILVPYIFLFSFFLLLDNFSCVHHRFWSSPLPISFLSISSLFPYHDSLLTSWDIIHCILKAHWVLLVLPVCAWTEGDLSSEWVIHITLFLTRLWDCCGRRGRKHLRARGSEWMSAVKQSLLDYGGYEGSHKIWIRSTQT